MTTRNFDTKKQRRPRTELQEAARRQRQCVAIRSRKIDIKNHHKGTRMSGLQSRYVNMQKIKQNKTTTNMHTKDTQ